MRLYPRSNVISKVETKARSYESLMWWFTLLTVESFFFFLSSRILFMSVVTLSKKFITAYSTIPPKTKAKHIIMNQSKAVGYDTFGKAARPPPNPIVVIERTVVTPASHAQ